ncbi:MAG: hypothetical protein M3070_03920 [Actinomycetota bacterium]|nr:hypothetical protein [Actinomycetota bacterium]
MTGSDFGQQPQYGQPAQGEPPYGQPPYGQRYGAAPQNTGYGLRPRAQGFGVIGAVLAIIGAAGVVVAFTLLDWLRGDKSSSSLFQGAGSQTTFSKLHHTLSGLQRQLDQAPAESSSHISFGVAPYYFSWLGWVLVIAAFVLAILAVSPIGGLSTLCRVLGAVVGLAGVTATLWAIDLIRIDASFAQLFNSNTPSYFDYLKHASFGFWVALAGFLLLALGALAGPRKTSPASY